MKKIRCDKCDREFGSKDALDMHNKSKHSELYKEPKLSNRQKKRIRNYALLFLILLIASGFIYLRTIPPKNAPIIEITPSAYNFGTVSQAEGTVSGTVAITNNGNEELILKKMDTSCGCTSASVTYKGIEGPRFSMAMHGTNPRDWTLAIPPGETAQLTLYYNPDVHKDLRGAVTRSVYVFSNDPRQSRKEVRISAVQVD